MFHFLPAMNGRAIFRRPWRGLIEGSRSTGRKQNQFSHTLKPKEGLNGTSGLHNQLAKILSESVRSPEGEGSGYNLRFA